jgi:hypothetical protein
VYSFPFLRWRSGPGFNSLSVETCGVRGSYNLHWEKKIIKKRNPKKLFDKLFYKVYLFVWEHLLNLYICECLLKLEIAEGIFFSFFF